MEKYTFLNKIEKPLKEETESHMLAFGNKFDTKIQMSTFLIGLLTAMRILDEELWLSISFAELMDIYMKYADNEEGWG